MTTTRFGEAFDQRFGLRIEIEEAHVPVGRASQPRECIGQIAEAGCRLDVERDRDALASCVGEIASGLGDERQRKVVDRVIAGVFERPERDALAGSRSSAEQQEIHGHGRRRSENPTSLRPP